MKFEEMSEIVGREPVFASSLLLAGDRDPKHVRRQLSRWTHAGKIHQLRRGLYALAKPHQKVVPHPFLVANRMVDASYVSLQSALSHFSLLPEGVPVVTSVTTGRPREWQTGLGHFVFRHLQKELFWGYQQMELMDGQVAFVAFPEKALLDLIYLEPHADDPGYLDHLRLQNLDRLDLDKLEKFAGRSRLPKLIRAGKRVIKLAQQESEEYQSR